MPKKDIDLISDELWWICKEYNGIPSQTVDKNAYSRALHYLKTYGDRPEIKAVIKEFNLSLPKTKKRNNIGAPLGLEDVKRVLEERGRMPYIPTEGALYYQVNYFLKKNKDDEEVKRLNRVYASGDCCPLYERKLDNLLHKIQPYHRIVQSIDYVINTYEQYHEFPAKNTVPMKLVRLLLQNPQIKYRVGKRRETTIAPQLFSEFLNKLVSLGCEDEMVVNNWNILNKTNE